MKDLNALAEAKGMRSSQLPVTTATNGQVERLVRLLDARCEGPDTRHRLRTAAAQWEQNGGQFSTEVVAEDDFAVSLVVRHRVLKANFELKSRAFMLTYNSRSFTLETWVPFRAFVVSLRARFGARAWAACWCD